jgi:hypothetical protein
MALYSDFSQIATGSHNKFIRICNKKQEFATLKGHKELVSALVFALKD